MPTTPLHILVRSSHPPVTELLCGLLQVVSTDVSPGQGPGWESGIRFALDVPRAARAAILSRLAPLELGAEEDDTLAAGTVEVTCGEETLPDVNVTIHTDDPRVARSVWEVMEPWSSGKITVRLVRPVDKPSVHFGGAPKRLRGLARLAAGTCGRTLGERDTWGEEDMDLWVYARSAKVPRLPIEVITDNPAQGAALEACLREDGFSDVQVAALTGEELAARRFAILPGGLAAHPADRTAARLQALATGFLSSRGVSEEQWPVLMAGGGEESAAIKLLREARAGSVEDLHVRIVLPIEAHARGALRPYAGSAPNRFAVAVRCDDGPTTRAIVASLHAAGFESVTAAGLAMDDDAACIELQDLEQEADIHGRLRQAVDTAVPMLELPPSRVVPGMEHQVTIVLPLHLSVADRVARARNRLGRYRVVVHGSRSERSPAVVGLIAALREAGFTNVGGRRGEPTSEASIQFGGADPATLATVCDVLRSRGIPHEAPVQAWPPSDKDIYITVPDGADDHVVPESGGPDPFAAWECPRTGDSEVRSFLHAGWAGLRVGETTLRATDAGGRADHDAFASYVVDATTAGTLAHLAIAVERGEPVLLEGPTSTSKTSAILFLAAWLGQPVVRINLSAQTDTSELLGRYLPTGDSAGRAAWRWQDGRVVRALREGAWVVLDEINLAEPAVLERLNPLVEAEPSLVLTEHDGEVFGRGGTPIHPGFRVFATMNPTSYAGRCALSPALRDRFLGYRAVPAPTEQDLRAMLERLVLGRGHTFDLEGRRWEVPGGRTLSPWRGEAERVRRTLGQLARVWIALNGMSESTDVAAGNGQVYTRRGLLAITNAVSRQSNDGASFDDALRAAIARYVVGRVSDATERAGLAHVLDACGLGPGQWAPGTA